MQDARKLQSYAATNILDDEQMAFNKEEEIELKYNVMTGPAASDKKRSISDIANQAARKNPFAKHASEPVEDTMHDVNSSAFESAVDKSVVEKPTVNLEEINRISQIDLGDAKAEESAIEKEWREIKQQNEQERQAQINQGTPLVKEYPLKLNEDGSLSVYWFDAHEETYGADLFMFGKVWQPETNSFVSISINIKGMERILFALPKMKNNKARGTLTDEEEKV